MNLTINLLTSTKTNITLCFHKKGQGPKTQLSPSELQALAKRRSSCAGPVTLPRSRAQSECPHQCPGPIEEAYLSWWYPQGQGLRPYPAVITEGARHPWTNWPSGFSFKLKKIIYVGWIGIHVVTNTNQVNYKTEVDWSCCINGKSIYSSCWGLHGLRPMETATIIKTQMWGLGRGSLLLQGLDPVSWQPWWRLWISAGYRPQPIPGAPPHSLAWGQRALRTLSIRLQFAS